MIMSKLRPSLRQARCTWHQYCRARHRPRQHADQRNYKSCPSDLDDALPCIPRPQKYWNAVELALLGDTVWEYYIRRHCLFPPAGIARARERMESLSSAESQADCLTKLESGWLRERETDLIRWALNAKWSKPLRAQKKRLALLVYKRASALEVGDLHLSDPSRLHDLMDHLGFGKPDISCLGTLSEDELHGKGWESDA